MTIDLGVWPVSYLEQKLYAEEMERRISILEHIIEPLTIYSFVKPLREEWESEFTAQTGILPPIPPGTILLWHDLRRNKVRQYTTVYDLDNGLTTSGAIYRHSEKGHFFGTSVRYIGGAHYKVDSTFLVEADLKVYEAAKLAQIIIFAYNQLPFRPEEGLDNYTTRITTPLGRLRTLAYGELTSGYTYEMDAYALPTYQDVGVFYVDNPFSMVADAPHRHSVRGLGRSAGLKTPYSVASDIQLAWVQAQGQTGETYNMEIHSLAPINTDTARYDVFGVFSEHDFDLEGLYDE